MQRTLLLSLAFLSTLPPLCQTFPSGLLAPLLCTSMLAPYTLTLTAALRSPPMLGTVLVALMALEALPRAGSQPPPAGSPWCPTCWNNGQGTYPESCGYASSANCEGYTAYQYCSGTWFDEQNVQHFNDYPCAGHGRRGCCSKKRRMLPWRSLQRA